MQGDACDLPRDLGQFGCVLAANLICRLHKPYEFLNRLAGLVASKGILVITSPYTWLEQFTEKVCVLKRSSSNMMEKELKAMYCSDLKLIFLEVHEANVKNHIHFIVELV